MWFIFYIILFIGGIDSRLPGSTSANDANGYYLYYKSLVMTSDDVYEGVNFLVQVSDSFHMDSFKIILSEALTSVEQFNARLLQTEKIFIDFQSMVNFQYYNKEFKVDTSVISRVSDPANYIVSTQVDCLHHYCSGNTDRYRVDLAILKLDIKVVSFVPRNSNAGFYKIVDSNKGYLMQDKRQLEQIGLICVMSKD